MAKTDKSGRKERLAAALRENLKRRKARERALESKDSPAVSPPEGNPPESRHGNN